MGLSRMVKWGETILKKIDKILDKCTSALSFIGAIGLALVILVVLYNVIGRGVFNRPYARSYEVVQYGALACVLLGLTRTTYTNGHIQVTLLIDAFNWRIREFFDGLGRLLNACIYLFASWLFLKDMPVKQAQHKLTDLFHIPMQYIEVLFVILLAVAAIIFVYQAVQRFINMCGKSDPRKVDAPSSNQDSISAPVTE